MEKLLGKYFSIILLNEIWFPGGLVASVWCWGVDNIRVDR